jgi:hypothetical protein
VAPDQANPGRRRLISAAALSGYVGCSALYFGLQLGLGSGSRYIGDGRDATLVIWSLAWWPHALLHGLNPIVTHALWAPDGLNLTWVGSVPALALGLAPLTLAVGPVAAYNVAAAVTPGFAAWTAFLLCRHLTRALWPALAGGFVFGCSTFEVAHTQASHVGLTGAGALVPLVALVILRFLDHDLTARRLVLLLGPLVALQLLLSTEIAFTTAAATVVGWALGYALVPDRRASLASLPRPLVSAYLFGGLITAPFVYYLLTGFYGSSFASPRHYSADLLNFAAPPSVVVSGAAGVASAISRQLPLLGNEPEAYLGIPAVVIVALYALARGRTASGRWLLVSLATATLAELGSYLVVAGHQVVSLPWRLVESLPLFNNVLPVRLSVYVELATAVVVALWTATCRSATWRILLPVRAALAILPNPGGGVLTTSYVVQPFFTDPAYRSCLGKGETVLPLPVAQGQAMLWQAENGFRFDIAGGFTGLYVPQSFLEPPEVRYVTGGNHLERSQALTVKKFIAAKHVGSVVVDPNQATFFTGALDRLATPLDTGGVILYRMSGAPTRCPSP